MIGKRLTGSGFAPLQAVNLIGDLDPAITATGSTAPTAYQIGSINSNVTVTAASTGVILPAPVSGTGYGDYVLINNAGANALTVYPPTGGTINGGASASVAAAAFALVYCLSADGLTWKAK
jgi:hypothetical protein